MNPIKAQSLSKTSPCVLLRRKIWGQSSYFSSVSYKKSVLERERDRQEVEVNEGFSTNNPFSVIKHLVSVCFYISMFMNVIVCRCFWAYGALFLSVSFLLCFSVLRSRCISGVSESVEMALLDRSILMGLPLVSDVFVSDPSHQKSYSITSHIWEIKLQ